MLSIDVPQADSLERLFKFGESLDAIPSDDHYEFNFGGVHFATPAWMILIGDALRQFRGRHPDARRTARDYRHLDYAAHAGFFRYFGMQFGRDAGAAATSERFIPLTERDVGEISAQARANFRHHGDVIQDEAEQLAAVLTQEQCGTIVDTLAYSIREIVRNVVEHSGAKTYTFAAQYWPARQLAEVVVSDAGIGLRSSLALQHSTESDHAAIELAVLPGVSSAFRGNVSRYDHWANSGYGLFMTRHLCASGGTFALATHSAAKMWNSHAADAVAANVPGTTVIMQLNTKNLQTLSDALSNLRRLARHQGAGTTKEPSPASMSVHGER